MIVSMLFVRLCNLCIEMTAVIIYSSIVSHEIQWSPYGWWSNRRRLITGVYMYLLRRCVQSYCDMCLQWCAIIGQQWLVFNQNTNSLILMIYDVRVWWHEVGWAAAATALDNHELHTAQPEALSIRAGSSSRVSVSTSSHHHDDSVFTHIVYCASSTRSSISNHSSFHTNQHEILMMTFLFFSSFYFIANQNSSSSSIAIPSGSLDCDGLMLSCTLGNWLSFFCAQLF